MQLAVSTAEAAKICHKYTTPLSGLHFMAVYDGCNLLSVLAPSPPVMSTQGEMSMKPLGRSIESDFAISWARASEKPPPAESPMTMMRLAEYRCCSWR